MKIDTEYAVEVFKDKLEDLIQKLSYRIDLLSTIAIKSKILTVCYKNNRKKIRFYCEHSKDFFFYSDIKFHYRTTLSNNLDNKEFFLMEMPVFEFVCEREKHINEVIKTYSYAKHLLERSK